VVTTKDAYHFIAHFDIPSQSTIDVTLAVDTDQNKPIIEISFLEDQKPSSDVLATIVSWDDGWGVKSLISSYSVDGGDSWSHVDFMFEPIVDRNNYIINYPETTHTFTVTDFPENSVLIVKVEALDYAGNSETVFGNYSASPEQSIHELSINTSPISEISFMIEEVSKLTPFTEEMEQKFYLISMPDQVTVSGVNYTFIEWADGVKESERKITLDGDTTLTANYVEVIIEKPDPEPSPEPTPTPEPSPTSEPSPSSTPSPEPSPEPDKPRGGIPLPYSSVLIGLLLGMIILIMFRQS
jgi:hypothetical protein